MAVLLKNGPDELQHWVEDLGRRLLDPAVDALAPPLAGVRLPRPARAFTEFAVSGLPPRDDDDMLAMFTLARAGIRIAHVVTSPWYFTFSRDIARRARWAADWQASRRPLGQGEADKARGDFARLTGALFDRGEGFSVHDILETHAIVDGLQASMARPTPLAQYQLALELYRESPASLALISHLIEQCGVDIALPLATRLCTVALKFPFPSIALRDLLHSVEVKRERAGDLVAMDAQRFFAACRLDPAGSAKSTRELRVERRSSRGAEPADGQSERRSSPVAARSTKRQTDQPLLETRGWGETMRQYFDRYEALPSTEDKLLSAIHPMRPVAAEATVDASPPFRPAWVLYADGQIADLRADAGDLADLARWVTAALHLLDGLAWLSQPAGSPPRPSPSP